MPSPVIITGPAEIVDLVIRIGYFANDLMVIVPDDATPERRRSRLAYERLWDTGKAADVLVWTNEAFVSRSHLMASLPGTILREGRLLYAS